MKRTTQQLIAALSLLAIYTSFIYILGNGMYKETLNDESTMVWSFMGLAAVTMIVAQLLFLPQEESEKR